MPLRMGGPLFQQRPRSLLFLNYGDTQSNVDITNLLGPAGAILAEHGIDAADQPELISPITHSHEPHNHKIPASLTEGVLYDCVELFRGSGVFGQPHIIYMGCVCMRVMSRIKTDSFSEI